MRNRQLGELSVSKAAAETALLLAQIKTALEPAVRTGAPDLGKLPTRVQAALNRASSRRRRLAATK